MKRPLGASAFPALALTPPLAHQGGWDEMLMVVAPLGVIGLLLWIANRRVSAQIAADTDPSSDSTNSTADKRDAADGRPGGDGGR